MKIKVNNGTTPGNVDLCKNCIHARIRRHSDNREVRQCTVSNELSRWADVDGYPVVECSSHLSHVDNSISAYQAWEMIKKPDGSITFRDPNVPVPHPLQAFMSSVRPMFGPPPSTDDNDGGVH